MTTPASNPNQVAPPPHPPYPTSPHPQAHNFVGPLTHELHDLYERFLVSKTQLVQCEIERDELRGQVAGLQEIIQALNGQLDEARRELHPEEAGEEDGSEPEAEPGDPAGDSVAAPTRHQIN